MPTVQLDSTLERRVVESFRFPLGVYPVEPLTPLEGFVADFEPADGGDEVAEAAADPAGVGEWEEWPDRYMYDVLITSERLPALCRALFSLLPPRVYPILDVLGNDAYREIDPYIAYDLVGIERFLDGVIHFGDWLLEDGLVGFGAMSMDPFFYIFIDEHKAVTIRVSTELEALVKGLLESFDLVEVPEILGADAVAHEHRTVIARTNDPKVGLHADEIVERLQESWLLQLNIDTQSNIDDDGKPLGVTPFRCVLRCHLAESESAPVYAEVLLCAGSHEAAESMALDTAATNSPHESAFTDVRLVSADRFTADGFASVLREAEVTAEASEFEDERVFAVRWFDAGR
jgi:hypothetical protein